MNPEAAKMMRRFGCCDLIPLHYGAFYGKYARNDEVAVFVITKQLDAAERYVGDLFIENAFRGIIGLNPLQTGRFCGHHRRNFRCRPFRRLPVVCGIARQSADKSQERQKDNTGPHIK